MNYLDCMHETGVLVHSAGIFFKARDHAPLPTLICLYNSLFSSFLNYGIIALGLTYETYLKPIVVGLFDSPILVGGAKKPPYLTLDW